MKTANNVPDGVVYNPSEDDANYPESEFSCCECGYKSEDEWDFIWNPVEKQYYCEECAPHPMEVDKYD